MIESWLNGHVRDYDVVLSGSQMHCAGCGLNMGICTVIIDGQLQPETSPAWPFEVDTCPVCSLRDRVHAGPEDKLTARLAALRKP